MTLPDRLPTSRSLRRDVPQIVPITKKMVQLERRAGQEIAVRNIENRQREILADMDMELNQALVQGDFDTAMDFYDRNLGRVAASAFGQQKLAENLELLAALNQPVVLRYAR